MCLILAATAALCAAASPASAASHRCEKKPTTTKQARHCRELRRICGTIRKGAPPRVLCVRRSHEDASELRFAPKSVWRQPIKPDHAVAGESAARIGALADHLDAEAARNVFSSIAYSSYSVPVYIVPRHQRRVPVSLNSGDSTLNNVLRRGVPIPPEAHPAAGADGHMVIYQPDRDLMWEMWRAQEEPDGWHAAWGGAMRRVSQSAGYFTRRSWPVLKGLEGFNWGGTATSLPVGAGVITIQDLKKGKIDHALAAAAPSACAGFFLYPAQRTDGNDRRPDCLPEGARLRLDPSADVSNLPRITRMIARAAQKYGFIVRDQTRGQALSLFAEQPPLGTDPYNGPSGLFYGLPAWRTLQNFPWRQLQLMTAPVCRSAPCGTRP